MLYNNAPHDTRNMKLTTWHMKNTSKPSHSCPKLGLKALLQLEHLAPGLHRLRTAEEKRSEEEEALQGSAVVRCMT